MPNRRCSTLLLLASLLTGVSMGAARAAEPARTGGPNSVQAVDYALLPDRRLYIRMTFTEPLKGPPPVFVNHHPIVRIAFDFVNTISAVSREPVEIAQRGVRSYQVVQERTRTRLILKLDRPLVFETTVKGRELLIELHRPQPAAARDDSKWSRDGVTHAPRHSLREVAFQRGGGAEGRVVAAGLIDAAGEVAARQTNRQLFVALR